MRPFKQIVGHRMNRSFGRQGSGRGQSEPSFEGHWLLNIRWKREQRNITAGACGAQRKRKREKEGEREMVIRGMEVGEEDLVRVFLFLLIDLTDCHTVRPSTIPPSLTQRVPLFPRQPPPKSPWQRPPSSPKSTHNCDFPLPLPLFAGAAIILVVQQHWQFVKREWWRRGDGKARERERDDDERRGKWDGPGG